MIKHCQFSTVKLGYNVTKWTEYSVPYKRVFF